MFKEELIKLVKEEVNRFIFLNSRRFKITKGRIKATCICGCKKRFKAKSIYHQFYSRKCYSRFHRIPGMVRRIINGHD